MPKHLFKTMFWAACCCSLLLPACQSQLEGGALDAAIAPEAAVADSRSAEATQGSDGMHDSARADAAPASQDGNGSDPDSSTAAEDSSTAADQGSGPACTLGGLRSALYPDNWTPAFKDAQGRFLHDFSYAGYRHGEAPLPIGAFARRYDVTKAPYGADASGSSDATAAVQQAIDDAATNGGGIVFMPAGTYRLTKLRINASNIVLRGAGSQGAQNTRLHFPNGGANPSIGFEGTISVGPRLALAQEGKVLDKHVILADVSGLAVGDHVVLIQAITQAFIDAHHMTLHWAEQEGKRHVFFRRRITHIDAAAKRVSFKVPLRYALSLRDSPQLEKVTGLVEECGVESLSISNAADDMETAWSTNGWAALKLENVNNCWVRDVRSYESDKAAPYHLRSMGIVLHDVKNVTVENVHLARPQARGGSGNGYLFNPRRSSEVLIKDCTGNEGRHNFSTGWPFGTSGIVFLRVHSIDSIGFASWQHYLESLSGVREEWHLYNDFHMQLAMANLIDQSLIDDGWWGINRGAWSASSGMTSTENVFWNNSGKGKINSYQFGWGYVIGTQGLDVNTDAASAPGAPGTSGADEGTQPYDYEEHIGAKVSVPSLYEDQLARRLGRCRP